MLTLYLTDIKIPQPHALGLPWTVLGTGTSGGPAAEKHCSKWHQVAVSAPNHSETFLQHRTKGFVLGIPSQVSSLGHLQRKLSGEHCGHQAGSGISHPPKQNISPQSLAVLWTTSTGWRFMTWRTWGKNWQQASFHGPCPSLMERKKGYCALRHLTPPVGLSHSFLSDTVAFG